MIAFIIFFIILLISVVLLIVGLAFPGAFQWLSKGPVTRKKIAIVFGAAAMIGLCGGFISVVTSAYLNVREEMRVEKLETFDDSWHSVIVNFDYGQAKLTPMHEVEDSLIAVIEESGVGNFDGHEIAIDGSDGSFYMYGPDADKLFETVKPTLVSATCLSNVVATLRYGGVFEENAASKEVRVKD